MAMHHLMGTNKAKSLPPKAYMALATSNDYEVANSFGDTIPLFDSRYDTSPEHESATTEISKSQARIVPPRSGKLQGWKFGLTAAAATTFGILLLNVAALTALSRLARSDGIGTIFGGSCRTTRYLSAGVHLSINVLGSCLLSASNYTMQCLSSPSRQDIHRAHSRGRWLDIGVVGVRNLLGKIPFIRTFFWILLAVTSIPIHLLYNSAVFKLNYINTYQITIVKPHFLADSDFTLDATKWPDVSNTSIIQTKDWFRSNGMNKTLTLNLTAEVCSQADPGLFTDRGDMLVIVKTDTTVENDSEPKNDLVYYRGYNISHPLIPWKTVEGQNQTLKVFIEEHEVLYCLSKVVAPYCVLQSSVHILATVIVCNLVKGCAILWSLLYLKENTLVTVGDAVASFLDTPDITTQGRCWMDKRDVLISSPRARTGLLIPQPRNTGCKVPLWAAASVRRWTATVGLGAILFLAPLIGVSFAKDVLSEGKPGLRGLLAAAMTANAPQLVLSLVYIVYNGLFTSMLQACEWSEYYLRKKHLRVSTPRGEQRSTYWLHLPYRYSVPLLLLSMLLHWLISQSLSFTRVGVQKDNGELVDPLADETSSLGASGLPMGMVTLCGLPLFLFLVFTARRKLNWQIPLAGSCSIAISAACHRPAEDVNAAYLPVSWGEIPTGDAGLIGHCSFTSYEVQEVDAEKNYA